MSQENTKKNDQTPKPENVEIEPLSDESLEDVAGGWCSVDACSGVS